jgi:hypothetical protein
MGCNSEICSRQRQEVRACNISLYLDWTNYTEFWQMCKWRLKWMFLALAALPARAAEGGGDYIVLVVDSRRFTGWRAWWANVYNDSHLYFTLLTIITVPVLGLLMGRLTSFVLSRMGVNLKSRVLAEH